MARTRFAIAVDEVVREIELYSLTGKGRHKQRIPLLRELALWLAWEEQPKALSRLKSARRLKETLATERGGVPMGFLSMISCHLDAYPNALTASHRKRLATRRLSQAERAAVRAVVRSAGLSLSDLRDNTYARELTESIFGELTVQIDQRALEDILLAALEAYEVPTGRGGRYGEVYGALFGTTRRMHDEDPFTDVVVRVARVATQLRARGTASSVTPNARSEEAQLSVAKRFFSHLELVGDYHTHPYKTSEALDRVAGWEMSGGDLRQLRSWVASAKKGGARPRVALVVAIARIRRSGRQRLRRLSPNHVAITTLGCTVHIAGYRLGHTGVADVDSLRLEVSDFGPE